MNKKNVYTKCTRQFSLNNIIIRYTTLQVDTRRVKCKTNMILTLVCCLMKVIFFNFKFITTKAGFL